MKPLLISAVLAVVFAAPVAAQAQQQTGNRAATQPAADMTDGEVRRVDKEAAKLTIKHGEIKNLDMPPMTMVFRVKDATLLDKVKAGDKVRFRAEKEGSAFVVTAIEPAR